VDNYEKLSDKTIFLHDEEYSWHHKGSLVNKVNENTNATYMNLNSFITGSVLTNKHFKNIINDYYKPYLEKYIGPHTLYGEWTKGRLGCAQFVIDKSIILKNPKQMYIDLYNWILTSSFGEKVGESKIEAKFMEWTWDLIFISNQLMIKK
jgi:hypothetical protein